MGALEQGHYMDELEENDVELDSDSEPEPELESDKEVKEAVRVLLEGIGEDCEREGLKRTPHRVAKAFREGTRGYNQKARDIVKGALFPEAGLVHINGHTGAACGMVLVNDLDLFSYCESCLLPFAIRCHVSYLPSSNRVVGLSKLSRVSDVFAKRLQNPQKLAKEVCAALDASIKPAGVAVVLQCSHVPFPETFVSSSDWNQVCSSARLGALEEDQAQWNDFLALLKLKGVNGIECSNTLQNWCPSLKNTVNGKNMGNNKSYSSMVSAVVSIIRAIGEDPSRKELVSTPYRYVQWLMRFKTSKTPEFKSILNLNANAEELKKEAIMTNGHGSKICYELSLPFCSQCEHHLIPFYGSVHIGWFGNAERCIDRAHLLALVQFYACKLQVQERMTRQIAESIHAWCDKGVAVVVEANHICMISRGIEKVRSSSATISVLGKFATDPVARASFLQSIPKCTG
ncbi:GTP cyclohydrolase 1 [Rhynchospora pubera]|uniref:GTP cyclohydrolase 1 n=1 Tax=Rhynchospora pubera TaxID=906938 RepID=A0AAV8EJ60_9POAL|nr:GTP cyclohydrolase 1 [Rhynchospora pubera]